MAEDKEQGQIPQENNNIETDSDQIKKEENTEHTRDIEGLLIGGVIGLVVGIIISFNVIFAMQIGMFFGLVVGVRIKKK
ncbi:MAG: hypothetical protein LBG23_04475 [Endomicrobium sp.]|jgi:hypothetical protein|nr:hypothetical protein [Endomicrobium sp.]